MNVAPLATPSSARENGTHPSDSSSSPNTATARLTPPAPPGKADDWKRVSFGIDDESPGASPSIIPSIAKSGKPDILNIVFLACALTWWFTAYFQFGYFTQRNAVPPVVQDYLHKACGMGINTGRPFLYFPALPRVPAVPDLPQTKSFVVNEQNRPLENKARIGFAPNSQANVSLGRGEAPVSSPESAEWRVMAETSVPSIDFLRGICLESCPRQLHADLEFRMRNFSPKLVQLYKDCDECLNSQAYDTETFASFLCISSDSENAKRTVDFLGLSSERVRLWLTIEQLSTRSVWIVVSFMMLALMLGMLTIYLSLEYSDWVPLAGVFGLPTAAVVFLLVFIAEPATASSAISHILAKTFWISTIITACVLIATVLLAMGLYAYRKRLRLTCVVITTTRDMLRCVPQLAAIPMLSCLLIVLLCGASLATLRPLFSSGASEYPGVHLNPRLLSTVNHYGPERIAKPLDSLEMPVENPWTSNEQAVLTERFSSPGDEAESQQVAAYPTAEEVSSISDGSEERDGEFLEEAVDHYKATENLSGPSLVAEKQVEKLLIEPTGSDYILLREKVPWLSIVGTISFLSATLFLLEFVITLNQYLVAGWTIVWYFCVPDIAGSRCVDWGLVGEATSRIFRNHLGTVTLIAGVNYTLRLIRSPFALLPYIPIFRRLVDGIVTDYAPASLASFGDTFEKFLTTVSGTTIAECLLQGEDLLSASESVQDRTTHEKCVTRLLRFGALSCATPVLWFVPMLCSLFGIALIEMIPPLHESFSHYFVYSPPLTGSAIFLSTFYVSLALTGAVTQACDTVIACYRLERSSKIRSYLCTPDPISMVSVEIQTAASQLLHEGDEVPPHFLSGGDESDEDRFSKTTSFIRKVPPKMEAGHLEGLQEAPNYLARRGYTLVGNGGNDMPGASPQPELAGSDKRRNGSEEREMENGGIRFSRDLRLSEKLVADENSDPDRALIIKSVEPDDDKTKTELESVENQANKWRNLKED